MKLGATLTKLLKEKRLTIRKLASITGINHQTLSEWKVDRTPRNMNDVKKVAKALDVTFHYLMFGEEEETSQESLLRQYMESKGEKGEILFGEFEVVLRPLRKR